MDNIRPRLQLPLIERGMKVMPVVVVTGARQTGKTTLVRSLPKARPYLTLDRLEIWEQARSQPESLVRDPPLILDEVQRIPALLSAIKRKVDENRKPGSFLLTGSANLSLMQSVSESLAGRALYLELPPFCPVEWVSSVPNALKPLDDLFLPTFNPRDWPSVNGDWLTWVLSGGFPSVLQLDNPDDRDLWFSGYAQTYLERDLRDLTQVADLPAFQKLMRLTAQRTGKLLNQSEIAREMTLPQPTAHRYLNLLETGYQITRLPVYATNPATSLVKAKKVFWNDSGVAAWLAGMSSPEKILGRFDSGQWLEQGVFQTLQSWRSLDPAKRRIYYWRNRLGREVDFVLEKHGEIVALEVKLSATVGARDTDGLTAFQDALGQPNHLIRSAVIYGGTEARALSEGCYALPWGWMFPMRKT